MKEIKFEDVQEKLSRRLAQKNPETLNGKWILISGFLTTECHKSLWIGGMRTSEECLIFVSLLNSSTGEAKFFLLETLMPELWEENN
jgi:hypothetical protein